MVLTFVASNTNYLIYSRWFSWYACKKLYWQFICDVVRTVFIETTYLATTNFFVCSTIGNKKKRNGTNRKKNIPLVSANKFFPSLFVNLKHASQKRCQQRWSGNSILPCAHRKYFKTGAIWVLAYIFVQPTLSLSSYRRRKQGEHFLQILIKKALYSRGKMKFCMGNLTLF